MIFTICPVIVLPLAAFVLMLRFPRGDIVVLLLLFVYLLPASVIANSLGYRTLEIAGSRFTHVEAAVDPKLSASDVNIGVSVLRRFRIATDFANHAVWLDPRM